MHLHFLDIPVSLVQAQGLHQGQIVELVGDSGSGKTHILLHLAISSCLPFEISVPIGATTTDTTSIVLHGRGMHVLWFDCEGQFPVSRLRQIMRNYVYSQCAAACPDFDSATVDGVVHASLERIQVYQPHSTQQLLDCMNHALNGSVNAVPFVLLDGISSFYYLDCIEAHRQQPQAFRKVMHAQSNAVLSNLKKLMHRYGSCTVATRWNLFPNHGTRNTSEPMLNDRIKNAGQTWGGLAAVMKDPGDFMGRAWHDAVRFSFLLASSEQEHPGCTALLSRMVKPQLNADLRRHAPDCDDLFRQCGVFLWEIQDQGIA